MAAAEAARFREREKRPALRLSLTLAAAADNGCVSRHTRLGAGPASPPIGQRLSSGHSWLPPSGGRNQPISAAYSDRSACRTSLNRVHPPEGYLPTTGRRSALVGCPAVFPRGLSWADEGIVFVESGRGIGTCVSSGRSTRGDRPACDGPRRSGSAASSWRPGAVYADHPHGPGSMGSGSASSFERSVRVKRSPSSRAATLDTCRRDTGCTPLAELVRGAVRARAHERRRRRLASCSRDTPKGASVHRHCAV